MNARNFEVPKHCSSHAKPVKLPPQKSTFRIQRWNFIEPQIKGNGASFSLPW